MTTSRGLGLLALLAVVATVAGCDRSSRRAAGAVEGTWVLVEPEGEETVYLRVTEDSVVVLAEDEIADCFERVDYEIRDVDGDRFRLGVGDDELTIRMRREEDQVVVDAFDVIQRFDPSDADLEALPLCEPTNPGADCATLPALVVDSAVEGAIAGTDDENPDGTHYDLYRLEPAVSDSFRIDMESNEVDSYLILFDSAGEWIGQNDDRSTLTLDARIDRTLEPACYIVMATTSFPDEFGDYEIALTVP